MYRYNEKQPIISTVATTIITIVWFIGMLLPVVLGKYELACKIAVPVWFCLCALLITLTCRFVKILSGNIMLPTLFLVACCGTLGCTDGWYNGLIGVITVLIAYIFTLGLYKSDNTVWRVFDIMLLLSATFFVKQSVIWLIPAFVVGLILFDSFGLKTLMACLFGLGFPFGIVAAYYYLCDDICMFQHYVSDITFSPVFLHLRIADTVAYCCIGIYILCSLFAFYVNFQKHSIQFRSSIIFSYIVLFISTLAFEPLSLVFASLILAAYTDFKHSKGHKILFYTFIVLMALIFLAKMVVV